MRELVPLFLRHLPPPWGLAAHWWASVYHDTVSRLPEIQAPTLVMHGERDGTAPVGAAHLLAERIPDAELAIVPEAGHAFALEAPEETLRTCLEWLNRRAPIAPGEPRAGLVASAEPLTRALGLQIGALRTGRSLVAWGLGAVRRRERSDNRRPSSR